MKVLDSSGGSGVVDDRAIAEITARFEALLADMAEIDDRGFVGLAAGFEQQLETARLLAVARLTGSTGDSRSARRRAQAHLSRAGQSAGRSGRSVRRDARRAAALAANHSLAGRDGLTGDGIDALSKAADPESGAIPADLLDRTAGLDPDQASRVVDEFLEQQTSAADANAKHQAQMRARRVRRYTVPASAGAPMLAGIGIEGPDAMIDQIWALLNASADASYQRAGGRDRPAGEHDSLDHRRFDAARSFFTDSSSGGGSRPNVVVTIGINDLSRDGRDDDRQAATQIGCGPISDSQLADYAADSELSILLTGLKGRPLWFGRAQRHASKAQFLYLVIRDRGCVLCGAGYQRCQAHHVMPWHAPGKGQTDIDNLALLCGTCHRHVHDSRQTLVKRRTETGQTVWSTRPATKAELPPPTPSQRE